MELFTAFCVATIGLMLIGGGFRYLDFNRWQIIGILMILIGLKIFW